MKINNINLLPINNASPLPKKELSASKTNPIINNSLTATLWGNKNNVSRSFIPYFSGISSPSERPENYEKSGDFKMSKIDGLTCPSCGRKMLSRDSFENGFKLMLDKVPEQYYIDVLEEYEEYMTPVEANVFEKVKKQAEKHPDQELLELVKSLREEELPKLEKIQLKKIEQMKSIARTLPKNERDQMKKVLGKSTTKIKQKGEVSHPFKRKQFIEDIKDVWIKNYKTKLQLLNIAESFPTSSEAECAWIVKYSGKNKKKRCRSNREIAERFLANSITNTDHMRARNLGGQNIIPNYFSMHSKCNSDKSNKSFMEWFNEKPQERYQYLKHYLHETQRVIELGEIEDTRYKNYPQEAAKTIKKLSKGRVLFNLRKDNPKSIA